MAPTLTGLDDVPVGEDDPALLVDDEPGGVAGARRLRVEGAAGGGPQHDHGGDHPVEGPPPVLRGGGALPEGPRPVDLHPQLAVLHGGVYPHRRRRIRAQSLQRIPHREPARLSPAESRCESAARNPVTCPTGDSLSQTFSGKRARKRARKWRAAVMKKKMMMANGKWKNWTNIIAVNKEKKNYFIN